jgi:hypothetical protein
MKTISFFVFPCNAAPVKWNLQGKTEVLGGKTCPSATLSTTNPTWIEPGPNAGRGGERQATNRLNDGTANYKLVSVSYEFPSCKMPFKTSFTVSVLHMHTTCPLFFCRQLAQSALWPPLVYNLHNNSTSYCTACPEIHAYWSRHKIPWWTQWRRRYLPEIWTEVQISPESKITGNTQRAASSCTNVTSFSAKIMSQSKRYQEIFSSPVASWNCAVAVGVRTREFEAIPWKPQMQRSFISCKDVITWLHSWHGCRQVQWLFSTSPAEIQNG